MTVSVVMAMLLWQGCNKTEENLTGSIDFGMNPLVEETLKSLSSGHHDVVAALVTIRNENGELVYDKEYLEFYMFGDAFVTKSLKLEVGKYWLKEFLLLNEEGEVTWATPLEGSPLAPLVDDPLPIEFRVIEDETTHVHPQVVRIGNHNPDDFGYVNFNVSFVERFCLAVYFESDCYWLYDSIGYDVMGYDTVVTTEDGFTAPIFPARMLVYSNNKLLSETYLYPGENKVGIPMGYEEYKLVVYDCGNYPCFDAVFHMEELKHFSCRNGEFLHIECHHTHPEVIVTPEDIMEPTIEQGVFGRITQPVWWDGDSTGTEDYSIVPMIAQLYIYESSWEDSIYYHVEDNDCLVYPDMNRQPLAIVQSNSNGYYQLPMEEGKYNYMVEVPNGFYIDFWVSSHFPGIFEVMAGEVTILNIHVSDCVWYE